MEALLVYYGALGLIHVIMAFIGNITSVAWGAFGSWRKQEDKSLWTLKSYWNYNKERIFFGMIFTLILFAIMPVISVELLGGLEFGPLTAFAFAVFPIPAMQLVMSKTKAKIDPNA